VAAVKCAATLSHPVDLSKQRNRLKLLQWLEKYPGERNKVMDGILSLIEGENPDKPSQLTHVVQAWLTPKRPGFSFVGRYVPEQELVNQEFDGKLSTADKTSFEEWLRDVTTLLVNTEINVQLGEFTIKKNAIQPLTAIFLKNEDFMSVFERVTGDDIIQCADVYNTTNRKWVRLVGLGYDLQLWRPDDRLPTMSEKYSYNSCTVPWVKDIFDPWKDLVLPDTELYVSDGDSKLARSEVCTLYGMAANVVEEYQGSPSKNPPPPTFTLKEIVIYRYPRVFHVYNVVEYGRRWYRTLIFSSDPSLTLHEMKLTRQALNNTHLECSGDPGEEYYKDYSLVITRDSIYEDTGRLTYVPARMLYGLMPSCLLKQYRFWQNEDDSLTGYMPVVESNAAISRSILTVLLRPEGPPDNKGFCHANANALISRTFITEQSALQPNEVEFETTPDPTKPVMYLVNLMKVLSQYVTGYNNLDALVGPVTRIYELVDFENEPVTLHALVRLMLRLDCLSNIVAWTKQDPTAEAAQGISIDVIELPRLQLTFEKVVSAKGVVRYMCVEQSGTFLTGYDESLRFGALLEGLPRAVLLSNADHEYFVLMPAIAKPVMVKALGTGPVAYTMTMSLTNKQWIANTGEGTYFVYPVHSSGCFLSSRSIASSLYLLVLRMMSRNYRDVFRLVESCVCDRPLSPQERQIYDVIGTIQDSYNPDANACRLKLFFVTYGCSDVMPYPFDVEEEYAAYVSKIRFVSSFCRLSPDEEIFFTTHCSLEQMHVDCINREKLLRASFNLTFENLGKKKPKPPAMSFAPDYPRVVDLNADSLALREPLDVNQLNTESATVSSFLKKLTFGQYNRPERQTGPKAIEFLYKFFDDHRHPGFFLIYELFTGALNMQVLPQDDPREMGSCLLYILTDDSLSGLQNTILRIMETNSDFCKGMPAFEDRRRLKLPKLTGLDIFQAHIKVAAGHIQTGLEQQQVVVEKLAYRRTTSYQPPERVQVSPVLEITAGASVTATGTASTITTDGPGSYLVGRVWLNPRIMDFACAKRRVSSASVPETLRKLSSFYTTNEVNFLLGSPLHAIDLRNYVEQKTLAARGEEAVTNQTPLRVMQHPSSNSHIARTAVTRLEQVKSCTHTHTHTHTPLVARNTGSRLHLHTHSLAGHRGLCDGRERRRAAGAQVHVRAQCGAGRGLGPGAAVRVHDDRSVGANAVEGHHRGQGRHRRAPLARQRRGAWPRERRARRRAAAGVQGRDRGPARLLVRGGVHRGGRHRGRPVPVQSDDRRRRGRRPHLHGDAADDDGQPGVARDAGVEPGAEPPQGAAVPARGGGGAGQEGRRRALPQGAHHAERQPRGDVDHAAQLHGPRGPGHLRDRPALLAVRVLPRPAAAAVASAAGQQAARGDGGGALRVPPDDHGRRQDHRGRAVACDAAGQRQHARRGGGAPGAAGLLRGRAA